MIRRLARDRRGGVTVLLAGGMTLLLGMTAVAVDLGSAYLDARRLQGIADAAALSAAADIANAQGAAEGVAAASRYDGGVAVTVRTGRYNPDAGLAPAARFVAGATAPDAATVTVRADTPLRFAGMLAGRRRFTIERRAIAARRPQAAFSIGARLAGVNGGVANSLLGALAGGAVSLSLADYAALASADVDLFATVAALRAGLGLTALTYNQVLATRTTVPALLGAVATALAGRGDAAAAAAVRKLAAGAAARPLLPAALLDLGALGDRTGLAGPGIGIGAYDLVQAAIQLGGGRRQAAVDLGTAVPGLGATKLWVAIGERTANSPWLALTAAGAPVIRTAQARVYIETTVAVAGLSGVAALKLPLYLELAEAKASLSALSCPGAAPSSATLSVTPAIGHMSIAGIDTAQIDTLTAPVTESQATLASVLSVLTIKAQSRIDLGGTTAKSVAFSRAEVDARTVKAVSTDDMVASIAASLVSRMSLSVLGLNLGGVAALAGSTLALAAPALDGLLNGVTNLLGLHLGQADVRVNGIRCGVPQLVG